MVLLKELSGISGLSIGLQVRFFVDVIGLVAWKDWRRNFSRSRFRLSSDVHALSY